MAERTSEPILQMRGVTKEFPGVRALDNVDLRLFPGEVHALLGENGAGKSTLIKVLTGVYEADAGDVAFDGRPFHVTSPGQAQAEGISTVYQEVNLCSNLSVGENIFIGREPRRGWFIDRREINRRSSELLADLHLDIDPASSLSSHSIAVQQLVAITRAIGISAKVLILDEPSSSLDADEVSELFRIVRRLRDRGVAIVFITHFLDQVYEIADRMTILRNGQLVGEHLTSEFSRLALVRAMIGRELQTLEELDHTPVPAARRATNGAPLIKASGLGLSGRIRPVDLTIEKGEVMGFAGLLGSGRTELARLLFGADAPDTGTMEMDGLRVDLRRPRAAIKRSVGFIPEDRTGEGLLADLTVRDNVILALQAARGWARPIPRKRQDEIVAGYIRTLGISPKDPNALVRNLSGGNQQKVLLARWLVTSPRLLILDEPTRGVDVGAKAEIQRLVANLAADGMAVVFISAELEEVLRLSHRVTVLRDRYKVAELDNTDLSVSDIMETIAAEVEEDA